MEITYDAWGNFTDTVSTYQGVPSTEQLQALAMPFRYRGYVYDQETELYYLNTRYYDAKMHRFINADSTSYLGANGDLVGYNLYAYCSNNPVMYSDPSGHKWYHAMINFISGWTVIRATEAEAGIGLGFGASNTKAGKINVTAEAYRDTTLFFKDGKLLVGNSVSMAIGAGEADGFGIGVGAQHYQYTDGNTDDIHYHSYTETAFEDAMQIAQCPKCHHEYYVEASIPKAPIAIKNLFTASIGVSGHFILGGHASVSFNPIDTFSIFLEDWKS